MTITVTPSPMRNGQRSIMMIEPAYVQKHKSHLMRLWFCLLSLLWSLWYKTRTFLFLIYLFSHPSKSF